MWRSDILPLLWLCANTVSGSDTSEVCTEVSRCDGSTEMVQFSNSLTVRDLSCFHNSFRIVFSSSLKAVIDILMGAPDLLFVIESHHDRNHLNISIKEKLS